MKKKGDEKKKERASLQGLAGRNWKIGKGAFGGQKQTKQ